MTGSIACYKTVELIRNLRKAGAFVQAVMTDAATQFISPIIIKTVTDNTVYTDQWDMHINMPHINLTRNIDILIIVPCSADFIFKMAHGVCDDLLSTLYIARPHNIPVLIVPAMNIEMWQNVATKRNIKQIKKDGILLLGPDVGVQACGEIGLGRMLEPKQQIEAITAVFQPKLLAGQRLLLTAGPTVEPIDPIRIITNLSSGKMGYAIARAAHALGAEVTLISGPTNLQTPYGVRRINIHTAIQMYTAVIANIKNQDIFIAVAAVTDWCVANISNKKLKKTINGQIPELKFKLNPDILASVASLPNRPYCVGFAAESENLAEYAEAKRRKKNIPLLVGNIGPQTFNQDQNALTIFDETGYVNLPYSDKQTLAKQLMLEITKRLHKKYKVSKK